ncbi:MAG: SPOR domain-containing protein [Magnetococcales bacterium]|nr:SPOR domain-containing protein [Magnetococcales bacterium]
MKLSPNREQFMLVVIMGGLILFIVAALSVESLLSARDHAVRVERQAASKESKEQRIAPKETPEPPAPAPTSTAPKVEVKIPEELTRPANSPAVVKPHDGMDRRNEPSKNKPPVPIPGLTAQVPGANTPPPPPRPGPEESPEKSGATENGYTVQLGAFSSEEKANTLIGKLATVKLEGRPLPVSQQPIKVGNKVMYRVRMGPFASSARAKQAAALVGKQAGVEGTVLGPGQ